MADLSQLQKLGRRLGSIVGVEFANRGNAQPSSPSLPRDPVAEAELDGSLIMGRYRSAPPAGEPDSDLQSDTPIVSADGSVDFAALYAQEGVPKAAFTSEQAMDLQRQIPPGSDANQVQLLLNAVFKSFGAANGATPEAIVIDADGKKRAIDHFLRARDGLTGEMQSKLDARIAELQRGVAEAQAQKTQLEAQFNAVRNACLQESVNHEQVIAFFARHADTLGNKPSPK